jgi:adenine-specific DNA-methyltransferase
MITNAQTLMQSLSGALRRLSVTRIDIDTFKTQFLQLLDGINDKETEEFHKNLVSEFLKETYYKNKNFINTKGHNDLVIHNGETPKTSVGVIIEAKKPTNVAEMPSLKNLNVKAFHELILYYLRERITHKNLEIKHLVITNVYEWFIFDVQEIDRLFAQNKTFVQQFQDFSEGRLADSRTDFFYKQIAEPFIKNLDAELNFTHFSLKDFEFYVRNSTPDYDKQFLELYKIFSPEHLLKLPFVNDSNTLDKGFYFELLHIMGLKEVQVGGKKLIQRNPEKERNSGSILENAIMQLDSLDKISRLPNPSAFGNNKEERFFNVAMELSITWINRILFLKLLEAQLLAFHQGNKAYSFLNITKISEMNDLDRLFFQVLAKRHENRPSDVQKLFANIPYLNSSLFEITDLEQVTVTLSNLRTDVPIPIHSQTVLKDRQGKKMTGQLNLLEYLFAFLDAYDFGADNTEIIRESNKSLITASVLGLIFEKINGYKDGSFFTPGFITMYMCKEIIRKTVIDKFNEVKKWNCKTITELYNRIKDFKEANKIINSLKICDPSVGSGHFLVSVLNEMIAIKSELGILIDKNDKSLSRYLITVENDELKILNENEEAFIYFPKFPESRRIQETIFHEKQTIIENCLFGVDINPNSVKICRLRLWIELLKNAYYTEDSKYTELETLPNIDINIKCGNSLVSRFDLNADLKQALKRSNGATPRWTVETYRNAIANYQRTTDKDKKREIEKLIADIKADFRTEISKNDSRLVRKRKLEGEIYMLANQNLAFETEKEKKEKAKKIEKLTQELASVEIEIEEMKANRIFENAFEWRFEFPEVLNEDGDFIGFDVIIGNPPYIRHEELTAWKSYLQSKFEVYYSLSDLLTYFIELGYSLLKENGTFQFIVSNKFTRASYGHKIRSFLAEKTTLTHFIDFSGVPVFDEATVDAAIVGFEKKMFDFGAANFFAYAEIAKQNMKELGFRSHLEEVITTRNQQNLTSATWAFENGDVLAIKEKVEKQGIALKNWNINILRGILTGYNEAFVIDGKKRDELIAQTPHCEPFIKPLLRGRDVSKWLPNYQDLWMIYIPKGFTIKNKLSNNNEIDTPMVSEPTPRYGYVEFDEAWEWFKKELPAIANHLKPFKNEAEKRLDKGDYWWELRACAYLEEFEKPKIIYPNMTSFLPFVMDYKHFYTNQKCFIITGENLEYLCAFLNSKLFKFCFKDNFPALGEDGRELSKIFFEKIPVKVISDDQVKEFKELVKSIVFCKANDIKFANLETEIDNLIYKLYDLTAEEINIVENLL